ncbi:MAG TPA: hypothetical protein VK525_00400 [Candidatus Saccharimonadales bacterium]|nr:hypothetical protein [Candidatus Saccharimonadales bacterium]
MFVVLWEFEVKPGSEIEFRSAYGPAGPWLQLFRHDSSYLETRLLHDPFRVQFYVTLDFWTSHGAYQSCQAFNRSEYQQIDAICGTLTLTERKLGEFDTPSGP